MSRSSTASVAAPPDATAEAAGPRSRAFLDGILSIVGSVAGTVIAGELDGSPTMALAGAAIGAAIPSIIGAARGALRWALAIALTTLSLFLTYGGFTIADIARSRPVPTFPQSEPVRQINPRWEPSPRPGDRRVTRFAQMQRG